MIRSALAVLAGLAVITASSFAIEAAANPLLMRWFPAALPNEAALSRNLAAGLCMLVYTLSCVAGGGYVTGRLARNSPVRHAVILGLLQSGLMIPAMMAFPDKAPLWRWIVGMVLVAPAAGLGGFICARGTRQEGSVRVLA